MIGGLEDSDSEHIESTIIISSMDYEEILKKCCSKIYENALKSKSAININELLLIQLLTGEPWKGKQIDVQEAQKYLEAFFVLIEKIGNDIENSVVLLYLLEIACEHLFCQSLVNKHSLLTDPTTNSIVKKLMLKPTFIYQNEVIFKISLNLIKKLNTANKKCNKLNKYNAMSFVYINSIFMDFITRVRKLIELKQKAFEDDINSNESFLVSLWETFNEIMISQDFNEVTQNSQCLELEDAILRIFDEKFCQLFVGNYLINYSSEDLVKNLSNSIASYSVPGTTLSLWRAMNLL